MKIRTKRWFIYERSAWKNGHFCMVKPPLYNLNTLAKRWSKCSIKMDINIKTKTTVATAHVGVVSSVISELVVSTSPAISFLCSLKHLDFVIISGNIQSEGIAPDTYTNNKADFLAVNIPRGSTSSSRPCFSYEIHYVYVHKKTWHSKKVEF